MGMYTKGFPDRYRASRELARELLRFDTRTSLCVIPIATGDVLIKRRDKRWCLSYVADNGRLKTTFYEGTSNPAAEAALTALCASGMVAWAADAMIIDKGTYRTRDERGAAKED